MNPHYVSPDNRVQLYLGNCLDVLPELPDNSIDSVVTDPPYGLSFMGKDWDHGCPGVPFWTEALRVAKPGAHLLAFGGTRTFHRLTCAIEDAGWEIRDCIMWVYGSGFPKSLDVSKAIDKMAGADREVLCHTHTHRTGNTGKSGVFDNRGPGLDLPTPITAPATPAAVQWQGWGTALKPAWEPIIVARKPLQGTVAATVLEWGTGALNIDACRIGNGDDRVSGGKSGHGAWGGMDAGYERPINGRWPANVVHDGSEEVLTLFPTSSVTGNRSKSSREARVDGTNWYYDNHQSTEYPNDSGSAARFFYCAKASKQDRNDGCEELDEQEVSYMNTHNGNPDLGETWHPIDDRTGQPRDRFQAKARNFHPTVKPIDLMRWLCRLVTPPNGIILDPFMGSGSTGKAAILEGFQFIGCELDADYTEIAIHRLEWAIEQEPIAKQLALM